MSFHADLQRQYYGLLHSTASSQLYIIIAENLWQNGKIHFKN